MSIFSSIRDLIKKDRAQMTHFRFDPSHVEGTIDDTPARAQAAYFRIKLVQMYLKKGSIIGQKFYPAAHTMIECTYGNKRREIPNVADTSKLFDLGAGTGDVVFKNFSAAPLMPFNGGEVSLLAGLFGMKGENTLGNFIKVMSDFAGLLAVPQLSSAIEVAEPLANGLQTLFGGANGKMHLGYYDTFVGRKTDEIPPENDGNNYLREGYFIVIRSHNVDQNKLWVANHGLWKGDRLDDLTPYTDHDYLLFQIEVRSERDDWDQLSAIQDPFDKAIEALGSGDLGTAKRKKNEAVAAALTSNDLTEADRNRIIDALIDRYNQAKGRFEGAVGEPNSSLQDLMLTAISADQALRKGLPPYDELFE